MHEICSKVHIKIFFNNNNLCSLLNGTYDFLKACIHFVRLLNHVLVYFLSSV